MGEKDTNKPPIEMPGFEAPKLPSSPPQHKQSSLPSLESSELPSQKPNSVLELINLIEVKPNYVENGDELKPFKVKMVDRKRWINFESEKIGKATILFIFLSSKEYSGIGDAEYHVKEMEELSQELYLPNRKAGKNILEQVGVYLFDEHESKAKNRNLDYREIQKGIDFCLDEKNRFAIKAMVQANRGKKLPDWLLD